MITPRLTFRILDINVVIGCPDHELQSLVLGNWERMRAVTSAPDLVYEITRTNSPLGVSISGPEAARRNSPDDGEFLYQLEHALTVAIQRRRHDLYFLHAAALEWAEKAILLVAPSGGGKSTTTWGLLHHGFGYLSDELAPIDLRSLQVYAYPRALCLKRQPPTGYPLPDNILITPPTLHVPVPSSGRDFPSLPLVAVFFVHFDPNAAAPQVRPIAAAETAARLYANALNQLAHANAGLDAAARIAQSTAGFVLESAELAATCDLVRETLQSVPAFSPPS